MRERKSSRFSGKVGYNAERTQAASQYGYLNLPRGVSMFKESGSGGADKRVALLDFLPYKVTDPRHPDRDDKRAIAVLGELWYRRPFRVHRNIGVANDAAVCLTSFSKRCPICDERAKRAKEGAEKEETDALKSSRRNLYIVVPLDNKDYEEKPHIWDISDFCFQKLLTEELRLNSDFERFPDLEVGLTLRVRFSENQLGRNKFNEAARIDFEERKQQYDEASVLTIVPNLDTVLSELSYKELEAKFFEIESTEGGTDSDSATAMQQREAELAVPEPILKRKIFLPLLPPDQATQLGSKAPNISDDGVDIGRDGCIACQGTGKSSKGRRCPSCDGTGRQHLHIEESQSAGATAAAAEKPTLRRRATAAVSAIAIKPPNKSESPVACPHGHNFGKDTEEFDACDTCEKWEQCIDVKEKQA